jgi:hypothetical protein
LTVLEVVGEIFEVLKANGSLDILDIADRVAPKCKVRLSVVERMVRILRERGDLKHDAEYRLILNVKSDAGARKILDRKRSAAASA